MRTQRLHAATVAMLAGLCLLSACGDNNEDNNGTRPLEDMATTPGVDMDVTQEDMTPTQDMRPGVDMAVVEEDMSPSVDMRAQDMAMEDMSPDMAPPADELKIAGLSAPVTVSFDAQGVLHLKCATNDDCFAAQGYYHAAHRFAQMDLRRRLGRGRLSTLLKLKNPGALDLDISTRRILSTLQGEPIEEVLINNLDGETRSALDAYTNGVNAWLGDLEADRNGAKLSEEYSYGLLATDDIPTWEAEDSLAVGLLFLNNLGNTSTAELRAGVTAAAYADANLLADMYNGAHLDPDSSVIGASGGTYAGLGNNLVPLPRRTDLSSVRPMLQRANKALEEAYGQMEQMEKFFGEGPFGSNSWATAPALNDGDFAILANDPHLQLTNPALWYLAEMDAKSSGTGDFHAAGVSFAGMPGILIGHSEDVAWSATVAYWDTTDVYVETLSADGLGVMRDGAVVPFIERKHTVEFAGGSQEETFLFVPGHGPVVSMDMAAGVAITIKSTLAQTDNDFKLFINMGRTKDMADAKQLLSGSTAATFNFVLIDRTGNISYYPFAGLPRREWDVTATPAWLPLPGDGNYEWGSTLIRASELPQLENPSTNFILTANAAITDDMLDGIPGNEGYPPLQTISIAPGSRQARILDMIQATPSHSAQTHATMQGDTLSWYGQNMVPQLLALAAQGTLTAEGQKVADALQAWDYTCPTGLDSSDPETAANVTGDEAAASIGCAAFHVMYYTLRANVLYDELRGQNAAAGVDLSHNFSALVRILFRLLNDPTKLAYGESYWDDVETIEVVETAPDMVAASFEEAAGYLTTLMGSGTPDDWRWGRIHTLTLEADLLSTLTPTYNNGPYAAPGGSGTVNVATPTSPGSGGGDYNFGHGPSMRMIVEGKASGFESTFNFPGGQVHQRDSVFYDHLLGEWLDNTSFRMPFTPTEVEAAAMETLQIDPE